MLIGRSPTLSILVGGERVANEVDRPPVGGSHLHLEGRNRRIRAFDDSPTAGLDGLFEAGEDVVTAEPLISFHEGTIFRGSAGTVKNQ